METDVLAAKFESYVKECYDDRNSLTIELKELRILMDTKVSFKHFYWVIGIMFALFSAEIGYVVLQNKDISLVAYQTQQDVSQIRGKLEPYNVEFTK